MGFFAAAHGWGGGDETWHRYTLHKEDPKKSINHVTRPLSSVDIIFSPEIKKFCYIKKYTYRFEFDR